VSRVRVQSEDFDVGRELDLLTKGRKDVGGLASFVGLVRDANEGHQIHGMTLEHYPGMTEKALEDICVQADARWKLLDIVVIHRVGSLKPGDRLVSERDLAIQLGVGRPLVREALRALTMLGIVEIRDRIGTVVTRPDVSVLNDFFTFALAQQADMPDDVMQARVAIECQAIRLACERADIADFERLQAALARIAETINESDAGGMADFEFHRTMVLASHSQTLAVLHNSMAGLLTHVHRNRRELVQAFPSMKTYLIDDHRRIFEAVVARDPDRADATLRKHFQIGDEYRRRAIVGETDRITASQAEISFVSKVSAFEIGK